MPHFLAVVEILNFPIHVKLSYFQFKIYFGATYWIISAFQELNIPPSPLLSSLPSLSSFPSAHMGDLSFWRASMSFWHSQVCRPHEGASFQAGFNDVHTSLHYSTHSPVFITYCLPGTMSFRSLWSILVLETTQRLLVGPHSCSHPSGENIPLLDCLPYQGGWLKAIAIAF